MAVAHSYVSVSEQLKNARFVLSVAEQPLVATAIEQWLEEHRRKPTASGTDGSEKRPVGVANGGLLQAAQRVLPSLVSDFTIPDLHSRILETGYRFRSKNSRDTLGHLLRRLIRQGRVKLVKKGSGLNPNLYRVV